MATRKLFIGRLHQDCKQEDLADLFGRFGEIRGIQVRNGYGFVEFADVRDATDAKEKFQGHEFMGSRISIEWSRPKNPDTNSSFDAGASNGGSGWGGAQGSSYGGGGSQGGQYGSQQQSLAQQDYQAGGGYGHHQPTALVSYGEYDQRGHDRQGPPPPVAPGPDRYGAPPPQAAYPQRERYGATGMPPHDPYAVPPPPRDDYRGLPPPVDRYAPIPERRDQYAAPVRVGAYDQGPPTKRYEAPNRTGAYGVPPSAAAPYASPYAQPPVVPSGRGAYGAPPPPVIGGYDAPPPRAASGYGARERYDAPAQYGASPAHAVGGYGQPPVPAPYGGGYDASAAPAYGAPPQGRYDARPQEAYGQQRDDRRNDATPYQRGGSYGQQQQGGYAGGGAAGGAPSRFGKAHSTQFRLIVRNFPPGNSWQDLKDFFRKQGLNPTYAIMVDEAGGEGAVHMANQDDLDAAMQTLNGAEVNGNKIELTVNSGGGGGGGYGGSRGVYQEQSSYDQGETSTMVPGGGETVMPQAEVATSGGGWARDKSASPKRDAFGW